VIYGTHGANVLTDMSTFFAGKSEANGQEMPLFKEVTVGYSGGVYKLVAA
jgi:hypothetical protein